jgi:hypothetical protein
MAHPDGRSWIGGASAVTQVDEMTFSGTFNADGDCITTLTAEDGTTTQTVVTTHTTTNLTDVRDEHLADLQADTQSLFSVITWAASGANKITGTANTPGVPFYAAFTDTDTGGTVTDDGSTTANSGPNDWNTAANWAESSVPVADDKVYFLEGTYSVYYGLDQSALASGGLYSLRIGAGYRGSIGDPVNSYYLKVDVSNVTSSATPQCVIGGQGSYSISGLLDNCFVTGCADSAEGVRLQGTCPNLVITGPNVKGTITLAPSFTATAIIIADAKESVLYIPETATWTSVVQNSGVVEVRADGEAGSSIVVSDNAELMLRFGTAAAKTVVTIDQYGGKITWNARGDISTISQYGGTFLSLAGAATPVVTTLDLYGGTFDATASGSQVTISTKNVYGGSFIQDLTGS